MTLIQYLITDTEWTKNLHVIAYMSTSPNPEHLVYSNLDL